MDTQNRHIIGRQSFFLKLPGRENAYALQQRVGRLFWERLAPALEQLFDRLAGPEELIEIDRLEIDIGPVNLDRLGDELENKIIAALEEALRKQLRQPAPGTIQRHVRLGTFDQWLFYLEKGYLPWNSPAELTEQEWQTRVIETLALHAEALERLRRLAISHPRVRRRLLLQYPDRFQVQVAEVFTGHPQGELLAFKEQLFQFLKTATGKGKDHSLFRENYRKSMMLTRTRSSFRNAYWELVFERVLSKSEKLEWRPLAAGVVAGLLRAEAVAKSMPALRKQERESGGKVLIQVLREWLKEEGLEWHLVTVAGKPGVDPQATLPQDQLDGAAAEREESSREAGSPTENTGPEAEAAGKAGTAQEKDSPTEDTTDETAPAMGKEEIDKTIAAGEEEIIGKQEPEPEKMKYPPSSDAEEPPFEIGEGASIFVRHAGVVLLHPFLPAFFRKFDLLEEEDFRNALSRHRAVHLLHYLSAGTAGLPEYEMVLPKFLCGMPLDIPLEREITITEEEQEESDTLLQAAIEHWGALGSTSADGLREGFLQRDGKLEKRPNGWYLVVEQKTIDILLDQLPWSISMIKLPWMKELLRVEWA